MKSCEQHASSPLFGLSVGTDRLVGAPVTGDGVICLVGAPVTGDGVICLVGAPVTGDDVGKPVTGDGVT